MPSRSFLAVLLVIGLAACLGDPPPAAEDLPLEIVVHPEECLLNYPRVGPGNHEVTVIYEGTTGVVRILAGDEVVFEEGSGGDGTVRLENGEHVVECESGGVTRELALTVTEGLPAGG